MMMFANRNGQAFCQTGLAVRGLIPAEHDHCEDEDRSWCNRSKPAGVVVITYHCSGRAAKAARHAHFTPGLLSP